MALPDVAPITAPTLDMREPESPRSGHAVSTGLVQRQRVDEDLRDERKPMTKFRAANSLKDEASCIGLAKLLLVRVFQPTITKPG